MYICVCVWFFFFFQFSVDLYLVHSYLGLRIQPSASHLLDKLQPRTYNPRGS